MVSFFHINCDGHEMYKINIYKIINLNSKNNKKRIMTKCSLGLQFCREINFPRKTSLAT